MNRSRTYNVADDDQIQVDAGARAITIKDRKGFLTKLHFVFSEVAWKEMIRAFGAVNSTSPDPTEEGKRGE